MRIYRNVAAMKLMKFAISFHIQYKKAKFQWDEAIISSTLKYHFIGKCAIEVTNDHQLNSCELNEMSRSGSLFFILFPRRGPKLRHNDSCFHFSAEYQKNFHGILSRIRNNLRLPAE